jgi:uncharacterized repeat protein (TIGR03806 family)
MRFRFGAVAIAFGAAFAACGGDEAAPGADTEPPDGAAGDGGIVAGDGGGIPPTPAPYGLDSRPPNPTCVAPNRPPPPGAVRFVAAFPGLTFNQPLYITQAPGDNNRWYVVQKGGVVRTFVNGATSNAQVTDFIDVNDFVTLNTGSEGGLLGLAFAPDFPTSRVVYLSYTVNANVPVFGSSMRTRLARVRANAGGDATDGNAPVELFDVGQPYQNHDGGGIAFGPDGYLYLGLGDGGSGDDPLQAGQDLTTPLGKILRFDVSNTNSSTYAIPPDNPYANAPGSKLCSNYEPSAPSAGPCKEIYAYGFRNPWRWSFDRVSGELWVGDVGQDTWEEIDARVQKGGNYGWRTCEGKHLRGSATSACNAAGTILPIVEHGRSQGQSITGGYVYRGSAMPSLQGTYIYGDYGSGNVWSITYDSAGQPQATPLDSTGIGGSQLASFGEGNDGELYLVRFRAGNILKMVPAGTPPPDTFPKTLSATGCFDAQGRPTGGLIPYDLISPLWSDGAKKERWMALPDGKTITVNADGDWDFPNGTVLVKTFSVAGKRVETRLFMRHDDGLWAGYTYEWNDAQTDATLLPAAKTKPVGNQTWTYPSRSQCIQCHTPAAGGALGPETANMNRDAVYPSTNRISPQLATLEHIGMFSTPLAQNPPKMADPASTSEPLEARARSYLHSNCSHCHRPNGGGQGTMDLRLLRSFKDTNTCNATNTQGAVGAADKLLVPGNPAQSIVSLRMRATDSKRMPQIAVSVTDPLGTQVVDDWIRSLTACP